MSAFGNFVVSWLLYWHTTLSLGREGFSSFSRVFRFKNICINYVPSGLLSVWYTILDIVEIVTSNFRVLVALLCFSGILLCNESFGLVKSIKLILGILGNVWIGYEVFGNVVLLLPVYFVFKTCRDSVLYLELWLCFLSTLS